MLEPTLAEALPKEKGAVTKMPSPPPVVFTEPVPDTLTAEIPLVVVAKIPAASRPATASVPDTVIAVSFTTVTVPVPVKFFST